MLLIDGGDYDDDSDDDMNCMNTVADVDDDDMRTVDYAVADASDVYGVDGGIT